MRWLAGILALLLAGGGLYYYLRDDPLRSALNRHWPPVNSEQQRQVAIDSAATMLNILSAPNLAAGTNIRTIQAILFDEVKTKGVTKLTLAADRQLLRLIADFQIALKPEDLPPDSDKRAIVSILTPNVIGQVDLFLGAAADLVTSPRRALQVRLLPAVGGVRIDQLTVAGRYNVSQAADVIALILNRYVDNLSAAVATGPLLKIDLPATLQDEFDVSGPINVNLKEAPDVKLTLSGHPIKSPFGQSPFGLGAAAWLIDGDQIEVVVQLAPLDKLPARPDSTSGTFEDVKFAFKKQLADGLGITNPPSGIWVAAAKALLAQSLDSAFSQAQPCLVGAGTIPKEEFSKKIPTPDASSIDCTPRKDCTPTKNCDLQVDTRDCRRPRDCSHNHDTRDCNKCIASAFNHCIAHGNDPICEAAKAAQNVTYDAAFNACNTLGPIEDAACEAQKGTQNGLYAAAKGNCEADKKTESMVCEAGKGAERIACETEKGVVDGLHRSGNLANLDGSVSGISSLKLCFRDVRFADAMDKLALTLETTGSADLDTHFKLVPLDVAGHILCPLEWTADKRINASIPPQSAAASFSLVRTADSGALAYEGTLGELPIKLHFEPSPLSLVLQNINFALACPPAAGLINGLTLGLGPLIPEFLKDYTYKTKPVSFSFTPDLPAQSIFGRSIKPTVSESSRALIVSGEP